MLSQEQRGVSVSDQVIGVPPTITPLCSFMLVDMSLSPYNPPWLHAARIPVLPATLMSLLILWILLVK